MDMEKNETLVKVVVYRIITDMRFWFGEGC